jgi:hypothetical protein
MTVVSYSNGDGDQSGDSVANAFGSTWTYDQKQFYTSSHGNAGPTFSSSGQIYIIRHADGSTMSKIQIDYEYQSTPAADIYKVTHAGLGL